MKNTEFTDRTMTYTVSDNKLITSILDQSKICGYLLKQGFLRIEESKTYRAIEVYRVYYTEDFIGVVELRAGVFSYYADVHFGAYEAQCDSFPEAVERLFRSYMDFITNSFYISFNDDRTLAQLTAENYEVHFEDISTDTVPQIEATIYHLVPNRSVFTERYLRKVTYAYLDWRSAIFDCTLMISN